MKELIRKIVPAPLIKLYKKIRGPKFKNMSSEAVFTEIYKTNRWSGRESISGPGSAIAQTQWLVEGLNKLLKDFSIKSILDIPCGDYNWMQKIDLQGISYTGADIVKALIEENKRKHVETENFRFRIFNLISDSLPKTDLIIVRDCLVHFSYDNIRAAIENIKSSGSRYLLTTTFTNKDHHLNADIITGSWRPLNLQEAPFNFPDPVLVINENCTEVDGIYNDKSMALWEISKL